MVETLWLISAKQLQYLYTYNLRGLSNLKYARCQQGSSCIYKVDGNLYIGYNLNFGSIYKPLTGNDLVQVESHVRRKVSSKTMSMLCTWEKNSHASIQIVEKYTDQGNLTWARKLHNVVSDNRGKVYYCEFRDTKCHIYQINKLAKGAR